VRKIRPAKDALFITGAFLECREERLFESRTDLKEEADEEGRRADSRLSLRSPER